MKNISCLLLCLSLLPLASSAMHREIIPSSNNVIFFNNNTKQNVWLLSQIVVAYDTSMQLRPDELQISPDTGKFLHVRSTDKNYFAIANALPKIIRFKVGDDCNIKYGDHLEIHETGHEFLLTKKEDQHDLLLARLNKRVIKSNRILLPAEDQPINKHGRTYTLPFDSICLTNTLPIGIKVRTYTYQNVRKIDSHNTYVQPKSSCRIENESTKIIIPNTDYILQIGFPRNHSHFILRLSDDKSSIELVNNEKKIETTIAIADASYTNNEMFNLDTDSLEPISI